MLLLFGGIRSIGPSYTIHMGRVALSYQLIFRKSSKGGGSFSIQKFMLQILGTLNRAFEYEIDIKKSNFRVQGMFFQQLY